MSSMRQLLTALAACALALQAAAGSARQVKDLSYSLPTDNDALYKGDNEGYFMYCDRLFEGEKSKPWEAGGYGLVRNPFRASNGKVMFSRMHEGVDIKPVRRDAKGEPLDTVRPLAPGVVAYVSDKPGLSNYGRYVVVAHRVPEGTIYSLYAHLASVSCAVGQTVAPGDVLGVMGHSGVGLDRVRSHCHVEVCIMINRDYEKFCPPANKHGAFNGLNLAGVNAADLMLASKGGKTVSFASYISSLPEHYRVRVPRVGTMDLLRRHPFLYKGVPGKRPAPVSLEIAFTAEGVPIAVYPSDVPVSAPVIVSCKPMPTVQQNVTVNRVKNSSRDAALTVSGRHYVDQFLWLEGKYPPSAPAEPAPAQP